ncbi:hypothetical protein BJ912DRAFT_299099 [Pholiota molesta]|nr:hypothetical protein BJ912DRAFT_299099 [Pholiota molesta]
MAPDAIYDSNYTVTPNAGMGDRTYHYPRGRIPGGWSTTNCIFYQYGTSEDWNRYVVFTGDSGWAWANMRQYVQKHETCFVPPTGPNSLNRYLPANHGFRGITFLSVLGENQTNIDSRVLATINALSAEFPFSHVTGGGDRALLSRHLWRQWQQTQSFYELSAARKRTPESDCADQLCDPQVDPDSID